MLPDNLNILYQTIPNISPIRVPNIDPCNLVHFNSKINKLTYRICDILKVKKHLINFRKDFSDKRNYNVGSKIFKKYFGKKFKYSSFRKEILYLKRSLKKYKIKKNRNTMRVQFYKHTLLKNM